MPYFEVRRDNDRDLGFRGELLGEASSFEPGRDRWFELRIYRTETGVYVVEGVGRSVREGDYDKCWALMSTTPSEMIESLYRERNGERFLPHTTRDALDEAAANDEKVNDALLETV